MPRNYPPNPDYREAGSGAERGVWKALQKLPDEALVIAQYRLLDNRGVMREADFIVMLPGAGIGVLEVKGGLVWSAGMEWFSRDRNGRDHEIHNPLQQANRAGYALKDFVQSQAVNWPGHTCVAVLPDTTLPYDFVLPDSMREQWIDAGADVVAATLRAIATADPLSRADVGEIFEVLEQRLPKPRGWQKAQQGAEHADMITRDQYAILRALRTNDRILVTGGPGTGKTWLALEHARQETQRGARVGLLCYNRGLALDMQARAASWPTDQQPAFVGTLHQLALDWTGLQVPEGVGGQFWDGLPAALAAVSQDHERFDLLIVDEAQDFKPDWWDSVVRVLSDPDSGPMVVFGDEDQQLYGGAPGSSFPVVEVSLTENVRNTRQIAELLSALVDDEVEVRGASGPAPWLFSAEPDKACEVADQVVAALQHDNDFRPGDIALLTTYRRHRVQMERQQELGPVGFASSLLSTDEVAVSTVKGFKGLERPVVVLVVNDFHPDDDPRSMLLVGISRASHQVVLVGDREQLRSVAGDQFTELLKL